MSTAAAAPLVNGFAPPASDLINEAQEYEKILKLRDEIFGGTHPRLTVPAHALRKVSPSSGSNLNPPPPFPPLPQQSQLPGLSLGVGENKKPDEQNVNNDSPSVQVKPSTASGIDPVLLMKSEELVKAETQLHRQRLEKSLRDQFEQKRLDARKRPALGEAKPDFDVAAVLVKAQEIAGPDAVPSPKDDVSNGDSYDENSLYSSRAPDSTPEIGELEDSASSQIQNQNLLGTSFGANGPTEIQSRFAHPLSATGHSAQVETPPNGARKSSGVVELSGLDNDDEEDEEEEGEYSPPEAMEQFTNPTDTGLQTMVDPRSRPLRRYSELDDNGKRPGSPNDHIRIVRNHITSPIAPQPSRVSPLAVAKDPLLSQNTRVRNGRANQRARAASPRQSPDGSGQGLHPRKKRKLDKKAGRRRAGASPDIKDEPVSPPPFHDVQPLGSGRPRPVANERPIIIDDGPVREVRYVQAADQYTSSPMRPLSRQADPVMPLSESRVSSGNAMRPIRDETDLRRVASMHNMRIEQPREYVEAYDTPTRARAASYIRVDSPMRGEHSRLMQDSPTAYGREANQGIRVNHTPAPVYREVYQGTDPEVRYIPEPMPPPTRERIVVDQYGRRFREIIQDRSPVVPRGYSTMPEREQPTYYENYDRTRGQSIMVDPRGDFRVGPDMAPPPIMRQVVEPGAGYREVYEPLPPTRSGSVRPVDQPTRQSVMIDDRADYRAPVRMSSVRPAAPRYDDMPPPQMGSRAGSVRPNRRDGSVFVDDRAQVRREYMPVEQPRYQVLEPETRYVDAQGREIAYIDGVPEGGPRYVQRF